MTISLDEPLRFHSRSGPEDGPSLHEFLAAPASDVLPDMTALHEALPELLDGLSDQEGFILGYRFGLIDGQPRNLGEIAALLAVCGTPMAHQQVYALQQQALAKLRRPELEAVIAALLTEGDAA